MLSQAFSHAIAIRVGRSFRTALLMTIMTGSICAQTTTTSSTDGTTPLGIAPGAPAGSYPLSDIDVVNLFNGNVNLRLPLVQVGGRGNASTTLLLALNQQRWRVLHQRWVDLRTGEESHSYVPTTNSWGALEPGYGLGVLQGRRSGTTPGVTCPSRIAKHYIQTLTRLTFTAQDGTEFELRDQLTGGKPATYPGPCASGASRGTVFVTADGTAATFISDATISDAAFTDEFKSFTPSGFLILRDGTRYRIDIGRVISMRDRNGNTLTASYDGFSSPSTITDSLKRSVTFSYTFGVEDVITYTGFAGTQRTIRVSKTDLGNALRPGFTLKTYSQLFPELNGSAFSTYNPKVTSAVLLPDGRSYRFYYDSYGELARVELPTGGAIEYDYVSGTGVYSTFIDDSDEYGIFRPVVERRVLSNGVTVVSKTRYSGLPNTVVDHLDPGAGDALLAREKHYFYGSPVASLYPQPVHYPVWQTSKEYQTEHFSADGVTLLRRLTNTWQQRAPVSWFAEWAGCTCAGCACPDSEPANDPRLIESLSYLTDVTPNLVSKRSAVNPQTGAIGFDQYNNQTDVWEYDFGSGVPGPLLRRTHTDYLVTNPVNGVNYAGDNNIHIRSTPTQQAVYDAAGAERARTTFEYDSYTAGLTDRVNISKLDSQFTTTYLTRANQTAVTRWVLPTTQITTRMQYDIAGNVVSATDPLNHTTAFDFIDRFGSPDGEAQSNIPPPELADKTSFAFPTKVTNALTQSWYTQYDYYLGRPVNGEDANGVVTKGDFRDDLGIADPLDRPRQLVLAVGTSIQTRTLFTYDDTNRILTTQSDLNGYGDGLLKSENVYDGLGRTFETRSYETEGAYITTKQEFDGLGRVKRSYNPFRTTSDDTYGYADTTYDGLGRVTKIETFNGSASSTGSVVTAYSGNATTVTDQAGKKRRSITDGLGRLIRVDEPDSNGNLDNTAVPPQPLQPTSYFYDVLDDLVKVTQGGQTRFFTYDSLKRLIRARNPEQDINTNLSPAVTDPVTSNSQWCVKYVYDANSNLFAKTDARNITTTYAYDGLNRVTGRTYTNDTPAVSYKYDAQSLPAGFPSTFDPGFSTGRLVAATYGGTSAGNYTGYDGLGRANVSFQQTDSQNYRFLYGYNLASQMASEKYPSDKEIRTTYDTAGRLNDVKRYINDVVDKTYASQYSYAAQGAVAAMQLGNGKWEHTTFNNRLQPTLIGLGTSSTDSSILRLDYGYGTTANNGNVLTQKITAPGLTLNQCYGYDPLNRLSTAEERSGGTNCSGTQQWKQAFSYDRYGNRTFDVANTTANVLGPNPTISQATNRFAAGQSYGYDGAGNLASDPATSANGIVYDAENRQTQYTKTGQQTNYYYYDGDGNRVKKIDNSGTTVFVYNAGGQLIAEYTSGTPSGGGTSYLTNDHLGSTRVVMKLDGSVARHDYLPFGEEISSTIGGRGSVAGYGAPDGTRQKFTQKERDNESGLDYFLARYYSSAQGRFTSADDFLNDTRTNDPASWNLYVYVRNNPLVYVDAGGEEVNSANLTDEQKKLLIDDWKKKTGFKSISFDEKNKLVIDASAGFKGGSATARTELLSAVDSTAHVFNLRAVSGAEAGEVAFADNRNDSVTVNARTGQRTEAYDTRIDFEDFKHLEGDKDAQKAFTVGIAALHEFEHGLRAGTMTDNPRVLGIPGGIETFIINHIRAELGLARRFEYSAIRNLTGNNLGYAEVRFAKEGKLKILRWKEDVVGGKRN